jgi:nucleoside-diphosphate-sugar epimerase
MIIGNGFMANGFQNMDRDDIIIFASGVSNSKSIDKEQFQQEEFILKKTLSENICNRTVVYFSTYSIDDPGVAGNQYVTHKKAMETLVRLSGNPHLIIRTSNVVGKSDNPFTITNYLYNKIVTGEQFDLWINAIRNLLDIEHLYKMVEQLFKEGVTNETVYLVCPVDYSILTITKIMCSITRNEACYREIEKGSYFTYDKSLSTRLFMQLKIPTENYLETLLKRYYPQQTKQDFGEVCQKSL